MPPASAIFSAADLPIPEEAPVTITTVPRTAFSSETLPLQAPAEPQQLVGDLLLEDLREPADHPERARARRRSGSGRGTGPGRGGAPSSPRACPA